MQYCNLIKVKGYTTYNAKSNRKKVLELLAVAVARAPYLKVLFSAVCLWAKVRRSSKVTLWRNCIFESWKWKMSFLNYFKDLRRRRRRTKQTLKFICMHRRAEFKPLWES